MLFRVSGRLANNTPFTTRVEAPTVIGAVSTARAALNEAGSPDESISEIRVRAAKGGKSIRFGNPNAPRRGGKKTAAATATTDSTPAASTPASAAKTAAKTAAGAAK